jgi:hypothetical protein
MCITCRRPYSFKQLQAGHFIAGRTNSVLFDERGVNSQCYGCNVGRGGAHVEYFIWMEKEYGRDVIDELRAKRHQTQKFTVEDYKATEDYYKTKTKNLLDNHKQ